MVKGRRRSARTVLVALAVALAGGGAWPRPAIRAQEPRPSPSAPVAIIPAVETELLRVEVVVLDKRGLAVTDLKESDFVVLEEGQAQTLTHFQPAAPAPRAAVPGAEGAPPPDSAPLAATPQGRHIVLALDDLHMSPSSVVGCKEALKRFITEQVSDEDEVAVVTTSNSIGLFQAFTRQRAVLRRAIDRLAYRERRGTAGGRALMSEREAEAIDSGDREAFKQAVDEITLRDMASVPNPFRYEAEARGQAKGIIEQTLDTTKRTLITLEGIVRSLGPIPGRKLLVLVTDGFLVGQGSRDPRAYDMRLIFDASARAGVSLYVLHSRGLEGTPAGGDASAEAPMSQRSPAIREGFRRSADLKERDNIGFLAEGTGGFLVHGTNDLTLGLGRILSDSAAAYLMAYAPADAARDGRFRAIVVKVAGHPEYTVRARKGYFAPDGRKPPAPAPAAGRPGSDPRGDQELRTALASLVPLGGLPLQLAVDFVDLPPEGLQLVVRGHVEASGIPFAIAGERHQAVVDVLAVIYDDSGQVVGDIQSYRADLDLGPESYHRLLEEGLRYQKALALKPGAYQVRLVARESSSSKVGSTFQWIEVPDLKAGPLALSSVFLYAGPKSQPAAAAGGWPSDLKDVQARRRFPAGESLYYRAYAYNAARDEQGHTDVVVQSQVWTLGKLQGASPVQPVAFADGTAPSQEVSGRITLEGLTPGDYELRLLVVDRKAKANALRRVTFTVG